MDEEQMDPRDAALQRSRLHISAARILIDHHKTQHAIGTLHDAIESALLWVWYEIDGGEAPEPVELYQMVKDRKTLQAPFDFSSFHQLMEDSLEEEPEVDMDLIWIEVTELFEELGVVPFELDIHPEDDEKTREILGI